MADDPEQDVKNMPHNPPSLHRTGKACVVAILNIAVALAANIPAATADDRSFAVDRLFMSPAERDRLDAERSGTPAPAVPSAARPNALSKSSDIVLNGVVRRSDGPATVWVNGQTLGPNDVSATGIQLRRGPDADSRVLLSTDDGASLALKPGQVWRHESGRVIACIDCRPVSNTTRMPSNPPSGASAEKSAATE